MWVIVACAVAGAAFFGTASALSPKIYESRVEVQVSPVSLQQRFGAPDAPTTPAQAIARELDVVRSDEVLGRADAQVSFDHSLRVEQVSDDTVAFVAQSISGPYAEAVANTAATTYVTVRQETATGLAESAVTFTQGQVDALTARQAAGEDVGDDLAEQQARLADFQAGQVAVADTAHVSLGPTAAGDPVAPRPLRAATAGLFVGLVAGLVAAAVREYARARPLPASVGGALPHVAITRRDGRPLRAPWLRERRPAFVILTGLVLTRAAIYVAFGVNFILDDWSLEYLREAQGRWSSVPNGQDLVHARPGAWLTFTLLHGIVGPHPLIQFLVLTAVNVAVVLVLYAVFARFLDRGVALLVTAIWVLLPIHQSMTVWSGTSQITVGALVFLLGLLAYTHGRWFLAGLGFAGSILCYELSVPMAFAAALVVATPLLPLVPDAPSRRSLRLRDRALVLVMIGLTTWWSRAHAVYPVDLRMPSPSTLWSAHFGIGLLGELDAPDRVVMALGALFAAAVVIGMVWWLAGDRSRDGGPSLILAGIGVFGLGLYVAFTVSTGVLGFNDRLYSLSSIGAAMMIAGVGLFVWRRLPLVTVGAAVVLLAVALFGQVLSLQSWSYAGGDVVALLNYLERNYPDPAGTHFIVGPTPQYRNNVMGAVSPYGGADSAYRLTFPEAGPPCQPPPAPCAGSLVIANSADEFAPTERGETLIEWSRILGADGVP